ncbi:potassium channel family protein [Geosporobacter ferrireducens]|uniref:Ion transport domain-containing protein n=1 Tax=Geosporobacter ferrireducens TaxID=1424294 RepID=A0A1D8GBM8_9FIRM|nr:potassium channel family protein [Geosporobacter ferrireducens]AOT68304.1 hypothetical protein Gferi_01090 [Geosporobacter ferrireducens]
MIGYEIWIFLLAIIAVSITILDLNNRIIITPNSSIYWLDNGILAFFTADYFIRLAISKNKKEFFKYNILDLVAIIPYSSVFRIFRAFRLIKVIRITKAFKITRLIRGFALANKIKTRVSTFVNTNGFIYILYLTIITIVLGAIGIYFAEFKSNIKSFEDALWWSFVTATTVGYGDIAPTTTIGRMIAAILMIVGIGFISMLTGTIATFFLKVTKVSRNNQITAVVDISDLGDEKIKQVLDYIEFIRNK